MKKHGTIVVVNFTYKKKSGFIGSVYHKFMSYSCNNDYIDYFHILSHTYVERMNRELGIPKEKFIVTGFGVDDIFEKYKDNHTQERDFCMSIGRSNRDFDWLVDVWKNDCLKNRLLVILSDTWSPKEALPENVIWRNDVLDEDQYPYFNDARLCITPIYDGGICSGDTVLLTGMMFSKPVVVTTPSTLAEMYVNDGVNGLCLTKDVSDAAHKISDLINDEKLCEKLGNSARQTYLEKFSRYSMGKAIMKHLAVS